MYWQTRGKGENVETNTVEMAHCHSKRMLITRLGTGFDEGSSTWTKEPISKEPCATFNFTSELHFSRCKKWERKVTLPLLACGSWSRGDKLLVMMCSWCFNFNHSFSPIFMDRTTGIMKSTLANRAGDMYEINFVYLTTSRRDNIGSYHLRQGKWTGIYFSFNLSISVPLIRCHFTASP